MISDVKEVVSRINKMSFGNEGGENVRVNSRPSMCMSLVSLSCTVEIVRQMKSERVMGLEILSFYHFLLFCCLFVVVVFGYLLLSISSIIDQISFY